MEQLINISLIADKQYGFVLSQSRAYITIIICNGLMDSFAAYKTAILHLIQFLMKIYLVVSWNGWQIL